MNEKSIAKIIVNMFHIICWSLIAFCVIKIFGWVIIPTLLFSCIITIIIVWAMVTSQES